MKPTPMIIKMFALAAVAAIVACTTFFYTGPEASAAIAASPAMAENCLLLIL